MERPRAATHRKLSPTTPERSALFKRVRRKGTTPEIVVRDLLRGLGFAYRTNVEHIPGSPDVMSADRSRVVFVHGCYWHRHSNCSASTSPKRNAAFWREKFLANIRRDRRKVRQLRALGYRVMIVWECQTKSEIRLARLERRLARFFG